MKKIIKEVQQGVVQITIADERWYLKNNKFYPSVTWIAGYYPKGIGFYKWLADKGWDEAEAIKNAAGDKGSKVHNAIIDLLDGKEVAMDAKYTNPTTEKEEELTLEEYDCLLSFQDWFNAFKPKVLAREIVALNPREKYAGTIDFICQINGKTYLVDFKTSQQIWPEFEIQVSAYKHAVKIKGIKNVQLAILQLGYKRNKNFYKFTEIEDKFDLFLSAKKIWANENEGVEPKKKDYPMSLKLNSGLSPISKTPKQNATDNSKIKPKSDSNPIRRQRKIRNTNQRKTGNLVR